MARWLVKEEPTHYAYADLARDGKAEWNGVHNALALRHLKSMRPGDEVLYYHTGDERAVVGIAKVGGSPRPDPDDDRGSWTVVIRPVRPLRTAVPLSTLKSDPTLAGFDLVRIGRLSVMPVQDEQWSRILSYEGTAGGAVQSSAPARRPSRRSATPRNRGST
jgi:predicted RNA-binding protein with PUA-like domain